MVDLGDGKMLRALLEIISSKEIKINNNPKMRVQKLENIQASLEFLKREGIKLVSIGADNICDGNRTLIMGLIWTIILRYQIQVEEGSSAKKELLEWVRSKMYVIQIILFYLLTYFIAQNTTLTTLPMTGAQEKLFVLLLKLFSLDK
jgi:filamin